MFSTFRKLFGTRAEKPVDSANPLRAPAAGSLASGHTSRATRSDLQSRQAAPPASTPTTLAIPLRSILDRLPPELSMRLRQLDVGDAHISIPTQRVLSQITHGAVKITFAELRQASPPGTFTPEEDRDRSPVEVPLHEVLARLNPALLSRRATQKQVSIPAEVTGPFSGHAQVMFTTAPLKPVAPNQPIAHAQALPTPSVAPIDAPVPVTPISALRSAAPVQTAPPPLPPQLASAPRPQAPVPAPAPFVFQQPAPVAPQPVIVRAQPVAPVMVAPAPAPPPVPVLPPQHAPFVARVRVAASPNAANAIPDTEQIFFKKPAPVVPVAHVAPVAQQPLPPPPVYSPIAPEPVAAPVEPAPYIRMPEVQRMTPPAPVAPITPIAPEAEQEPAPIRFSMPPPVSISAPVPAPAPVPVPEPVIVPPAPAPAPVLPAETRFLHVSVAELSASWPETVLQEIELHQMNASVVALPFGLIDTAIRQGKVTVPWKTVRSWIQPTFLASGSPLDATALDLPLRILTPLFLAELRHAKPQKRITIDENIPDLFANGSQAVAPAPAPLASNIPKVVVAAAPVNAPRPAPVTSSKLADTNYFGKNPAAQAEEIAPALKKGPSPGTAFLVRYATPNEIVSKAAALDGVDGALIALPDGLLVASHIPPTMNADTIAAFLPQIFSRVSQCTKELRLGDLNNLNFTVGNIPWKIFKVGAIYFATFGRPGEPLPTAQLAGIAAELDRKAK